MLAGMTGLRRRIPAIDFDEGSPIPLALVFQLTDKLTPSDITDGFCKRVVFDHILDCQALYTNHLVFVYYPCGEFVLVISSAVLDTSMHTGDFETRLVPVLRTFF